MLMSYGPDREHSSSRMGAGGLESSMQPSSGPDREQSVGAFVRHRRKANHMTQQELAELAGVGLRFLKELEHDKPTARIDSVNAVLKLFGKKLGVVDLPRKWDTEEDSA